MRPRSAWRGKPVRIPFTIDSSLPRDYTTTVTLKTSEGEEVSKELRIAAMGRTTDWLLWKPKTVGDYTVTVSVPPHGEESLLDNNRVTAPISIREEKLRVLVVESYPRWEYRYLRNALSRDPGVEVACLLFHPGLSKVGGGNKDYIKQFPAGLDELSKFDVVFLGDVGLDDSQLTVEQCRLLKGLVEHQASGLVFMPGMQGRQFSLLDTELGDLMPVVLDTAQPQGWGSRTPSHFELTELGRRSLLTKLADTQDDNIEVWEELPGFQWHAPVLKAQGGERRAVRPQRRLERVRPVAASGHEDFRRRQSALHGDRRRLAVAQRGRRQIPLPVLGTGRPLDGLSAEHGQRRVDAALLRSRPAPDAADHFAARDGDGQKRRAAP